jgi:DNA-binding response OmpR family regulator
MPRILVIDDDVDLCALIQEYLEPEGFEVEAVHSGQRGLERARSSEHTLVVLDVMLPGISGFELLRILRSTSEVPVLLLTARGGDVDRVVGLELGADDYLPKPFNPRELVARIHAILRRVPDSNRSRASMEPLVVGDLELNPASRSVSIARKPIELTAVEFNLLELLLRHAGHIVTREQIVKSVLGRILTPYDRSLDMHISRLRRKLSDDRGQRIKTVRSVGYLYAAAERAATR